jgi:biopolymer transport protein ExbB/TolQ
MLDRSGVSYLIIILFLFGLFHSFRNAYQVNRELQILKRLEKVRALESTMKGEVSDLFRHSLELIAQHHPADFENFTIGFSTKMSAKIRSVSAVSGILITVGLLGTVIGLIITVGGISQVLDSAGQDYDAMISGLNTTVEGMGSAFYTTFFGGLLGGVILRALSTENEKTTARLAADCLRLGELWITPLSNRSTSTTAQALGEELGEVKKVLQGFSAAVGEVNGTVTCVREGLEEVSRESIRKAEQTLQEMVLKSTADMREGLSALTEAVEQIQAPFCAQLKETQEALIASTEALQDSHLHLLNAHMEGLQQGAQELVHAVQAAREPLGVEIEKLQQQFVELADTTQTRQATLIAQNAAELQQSLTELLSVVEAARVPLTHEIEALQEGVLQASKASVEAAQSMQQVRSEALEEQTAQLRDRLQAMVEVLDNMDAT